MRNEQAKQAHNKLSVLIENKVIFLYENGMSFSKIGKELKIGATSVKNILIRNNKKIRNKYECQYKVIFDKNFFTNINANLSYFWGFFLGDGNIFHNSGINRIKISVHKNDLSILEMFCKWLSIDNSNIKFYNNYIELYLRDEFFNSNLEQWGVCYNKTYNAIIPSIIDDQLLKSFLIGLIDADGTVIFKEKKRYNISIVGNKKIMKWFIESIKKLGYDGDVIVYSKYSDIWDRVHINKKNDVLKLAKILDIKNCNFLLNRKWKNLKNNL